MIVLGRVAAVLLVVALYYAIQLPSAWAGLQNPWGAPPSWVESGAWLYMTVHHLVQMLLALLVLLVVVVAGRGRWADWGFARGDRAETRRTVARFAGGFAIFVAVGFVLQLLAGATSLYDRPLTVDHVAGHLFFMWIVSGVSEEILFRGLLQGLLARWYRGVVRIAGLDVPTAGLVTAVVFALVHVNVRLAPFEIVHLHWPQLLLAFVLGVLYSAALHRTRSLLAPALMHNVSNGLMATSNVLLAALRG